MVNALKHFLTWEHLLLLESIAAWCYAVSLCINLYTSSLRKQKGKCSQVWPSWYHMAVSLKSPLTGGEGYSVWVLLSVCLLPDTQADQSDCQPDGPWCGWLDQVEPFQTTHSGWHKLWGLSVLGGGGSTGTIETLESNKLIRRETDTPVHYRVTETEGTERKEDEEEGGVVGGVHRNKEIEAEEWKGRDVGQQRKSKLHSIGK